MTMSKKQKTNCLFRLHTGEDELSTEQAFVRLGTILAEIANAAKKRGSDTAENQKVPCHAPVEDALAGGPKESDKPYDAINLASQHDT
jgi:hypothetical protein